MLPGVIAAVLLCLGRSFPFPRRWHLLHCCRTSGSLLKGKKSMAKIRLSSMVMSVERLKYLIAVHLQLTSFFTGDSFMYKAIVHTQSPNVERDNVTNLLVARSRRELHAGVSQLAIPVLVLGESVCFYAIECSLLFAIASGRSTTGIKTGTDKSLILRMKCPY